MMPRWGKVGKQKIEDAGTLYPKRMETVDDEILAASPQVHRQGQGGRQAVFPLVQPDAACTSSPICRRSTRRMRNSKNGWTIHEAGMAQLDDNVGAIMQYLKDNGLDDNTIVMFTTDNGTETFTWPDGGMTPFYGAKGTGYEGGFRCPAMIRWPGKVPAGTVETGIISGLDWFATFVAAAGNPNIVEELKKGKQLAGKTYKVHLDGYNQMDLITGKGPSARHEIFYFTESNLAAVRIDDFKYRFIEQPGGWIGDQGPPGRAGAREPAPGSLREGDVATGKWKSGSYQYFDWFRFEFWRFVFVQQEVAKLAMTAIEFPPAQKGASFNLDAVKAKIEEAMAKHGQ